jgi:hypothetical protein
MPLVLIIAMSRISSDGRVLRHIEALKTNYQVITIGYGPNPAGVFRHISIPDAMPYLPTNLSALIPHLLNKYSDSSQNVSAIRFIRETIAKLEFDLAVLNDVQTLPLMDSIKSPTLIDMHEYAPREMEDDWRFRFFLMRYYEWLCAKYLPEATAVTTVSDSLAREFNREFGVNASVILNAREYLEIKVNQTTSSKLRLIHTGLAAKGRQLDVMIDAVANIPEFQLDLFLVSAPRQKRTMRRLKRLAGATKNVRVVDPVPTFEIPYLINRYDLSLVFMSPKGFSVRHSMPNKLFDSIQARVGVVSGPSPDIRSFCAQYGVGIATSDFSPLDLRNVLLGLNNSSIHQFKQACDEAARFFNAETEAQKLKVIVKSCLRENV